MKYYNTAFFNEVYYAQAEENFTKVKTEDLSYVYPKMQELRDKYGISLSYEGTEKDQRDSFANVTKITRKGWIIRLHGDDDEDKITRLFVELSSQDNVESLKDYAFDPNKPNEFIKN